MMMFYTFMGIAEGSQKLGKGFVSREKLFLKIKKRYEEHNQKCHKGMIKTLN